MSEISQGDMDKIWDLIGAAASCVVTLGQLSVAYSNVHEHEVGEHLAANAVATQKSIEAVARSLFPEKHAQAERLKQEILKRAQSGLN